MSLRKQVEAILFTTGKFMSSEEIAKHLNTSSKDILDSIEQLKKEYHEKDSALTLQTQDNLIKLNIKKEFGFITNKLLEDKEMDSPTTKTLAIIAFKSPVSQSEIIHIRGNKAYDHISNLKQSGLVSSEKQGRTRLIKLTPHFFDYFDIAEKELKETLNKPRDKQILTILDNLPKPEGN